MIEGKSSEKPAKNLLALNPKEDAEFQKTVQQVKKRPKTGQPLSPGVLYAGHLPRGLFEPQLKSYFGQFGKVTRTRVSRSKKVRRACSRILRAMDLWSDEVAKIASKRFCMFSYIMLSKLYCVLSCSGQVVPPDKVHEKLFVGSRLGFKKPKQPAVARYNKQHAEDDLKKVGTKLLSKESKLRKRLAAKGMDYDFPGFDVTPVCTPSVLERRKSIRVEDDDVDDEIVIKAKSVSENSENVEDSKEESGEDEEEEGEEEHTA
uniref:Nucleolar protein interacting with the FHA domain of MKI67 n=1 Tax=Sinocyclocheilus anshuiensis TaxID=1608454 RepID=A0A671MD70_9TELE